MSKIIDYEMDRDVADEYWNAMYKGMSDDDLNIRSKQKTAAKWIFSKSENFFCQPKPEENDDLFSVYTTEHSKQVSAFDVWLKNRELDQYAEKLRAFGARRVADLAFLTEKDLSDLNVSYKDRVYFHIEVH